MSDRFAYFYQPADSFNLQGLVDAFSSNGITLANPANGRVTALSEYGDQIDTTLEKLETGVVDHDLVTFQLWMPGHADVCCRIRHLDDIRLVEEYSLVGLSQEEMDRVLKVLIERFKAKAAELANLFLVADREGYTIDLNWDQLSVSGKYQEARCPNILGIPLERSIDFKHCGNADNVPVRLGEYLIITNL